MILQEGVVPLAVTSLVAVAAHVLGGFWASVPIWCLVLISLRVFWERRPPLPSQTTAVLSPARGTVVATERDHDPWLDRDVMRVRIALRAPGIVPLRAPVEGKFSELFTAAGVYGEAQRACARGESPDCYAVWVQTDEKEDIVFSVSSRWPLSRVRFRSAPGERVGHGRLAGFVYFGSLVDVFMPGDVALAVNTGDRVVAGVAVLAHLRRR